MLVMSKMIAPRMRMTLANAAVLHGAFTSQVVCLTSNSKWVGDPALTMKKCWTNKKYSLVDVFSIVL